MGVPFSTKTRKRPGRRVVSVNPTPSLPPAAPRGRALGDPLTSQSHGHTRAQILSPSPSLAFLFWEATLGIPPPPPSIVVAPQFELNSYFVSVRAGGGSGV